MGPMRYLKSKLFYFFFLFAIAGNCFSNDLYNLFSKKIFRIRISTDKEADMVSYGTGFPVSKNGGLVTNFHVIKRYFDEEKNFKIFVDIGDNSYEAKIKNFDIVNDLALIKINYSFDTIFKVPVFDSDALKGKKIFSLGFPKKLNLSIVDGLFNGENYLGGNKVFYISSPINKGMSGGPSVDEEGRLIGVNVSYMRDTNDISFIVPSRFVKQLIEAPDEGIFLSSEKDKYFEKIESTLSFEEKKVYPLVKKSLKSNIFQKIQYLNGSDPMNCWEDKKIDKELKVEKNLKLCYFGNYSDFLGDSDTGLFSLKNTFISNNKDSTVATYNVINHFSSHDIDHFYSKELYDKKSCENFFTENSNKVKLKISSCVSKYRFMKNIFNGHLVLTTLNESSDNLITKVKLKGLSKKTINELFNLIIQGINLNEN